MDGPDLRIAVARALALSPATRVIAIAAGDLVDAGALAVFAAIGPAAGGARSIVADPSRLPFVEGLADRVVVRLDALSDTRTVLRELWRVLAPAGWLVVIVPLPSRRSLHRPVVRRLRRRRVARLLAAAMFEGVAVEATQTTLVIRAEKRDGLAPSVAARARTPARQRSRVSTNTAWSAIRFGHSRTRAAPRR